MTAAPPPPPRLASSTAAGIYYYGISDQIQSALEGAATYVAAKALLSNYLTGAHEIDLGLQRNKGTLNLKFTPSVPLDPDYRRVEGNEEGEPGDRGFVRAQQRRRNPRTH